MVQCIFAKGHNCKCNNRSGMVCPVWGSKGEAAGLVSTKEEAPHQGRLINFTQVFSEERLAIRVNILVGCGVQKGSD